MKKIIVAIICALTLTACTTNPTGDTRRYADYGTYTAVTPSGKHVECIDSYNGVTCDWDNAR